MNPGIWLAFPVVFTLPFVLSTTTFSPLAELSEYTRWLVLLAGVLMCAHPLFDSSPRRLSSLRRWDALIVAFCAMALLSAWWSIDPNYSFQRAISFALLQVAVMWGLWRYADVLGETHLLAGVIVTLSVVLCANLLIGPLMNEAGPYNRFSGFFVNPNNIGLITCLVIPLSLGAWLRSHRRVYLLCLAVAAVSLLAAGTRSAIVGVALASLLIMLAVGRVSPTKTFLVFGAALLGAVALVQSDFFDERVLRVESLSTASNRTVFWALAQEYIANRPWLGHGFGADFSIHEFYRVDLTLEGLRGYGVMSSYLGLAVQLGWVVTGLFFAALWLLVMRCVVVHWLNPDIVILGATILSGLIVCIFEPAIYSAGSAFAFLFWLCVMMALRRLSYQRSLSLSDVVARPRPATI